MKVSQKIISVATSILIVLALPTSYVLAQEVADSEVSTEQSLRFQSHYYQFIDSNFVLLDTYADPETAKEIYMKKYGDYIDTIQYLNNLDPLSSQTASLYKNAIINNQEDVIDTSDLVRFLDFYENDQENTFIINQLESTYNQFLSSEITQEEAIALARTFLPTKLQNGNTKPFYPDRNSGINLANARAYAEKYAVKPNLYYGVERSYVHGDVDCTNFASQILHAGGIPMEVYSDQNKGWWWKAKGGDRSTSWVNANVFKNYMGSGYSTRNWNSFVANVRSGDFIGVDFSNDGTVDHIGFVYHKANGKLRIAQHTRNYLDWNGTWPKYNNDGKYFRVRR